jgi:hypothetical protein
MASSARTVTETMTPDTRLGVTMLDVLYQNRAVKDEVMLDKQAGDIVYKRREDGRIMWYSQENLPVYSFISQLRSRSEAYDNYARPDEDSDVYNDTYFMTCLMDVKDWNLRTRTDGTDASILNGDKLDNLYPEAFSVSQEGNGFYVQLNVAPKDLALIQFLNARYNLEYENYEGDDATARAKQELYESFNYKAGQLVVNFTVTWYDTDGGIKMTETTDGYVCANELCFVPFANSEIFSRTEVGSTKLQINYIAAPKLAEGLALCSSASELMMLHAVKDTYDISFQTMSMSFFFTATDDDLYLPNWVNHTEVLLLMGLTEYEEALDRSAGSGSGGGIVVSAEEPSLRTWNSTRLWIELMRKFTPGETTTAEYVADDTTTMEELEDELRGVVHISAGLSLNPEDLDDFYVEKDGTTTIIGGEE